MKDLAPSIPKKILDWESVDQDVVYDRKTIYDYMDGGAEVYLAFDFRTVFVRKYKNPSGETDRNSLFPYRNKFPLRPMKFPT